MKVCYKQESSELKSYEVTAYQKDPNPNAIFASLYLSPVVPSYEELTPSYPNINSLKPQD